ncbi:MAG TPA: sigma-70 family RNA polymerase sigma factor [Mycobacterium sp.]|uniref:RNA polymerase sigma factor n=1 Tax=Mycobacterium sp. TaxID=1785 RepID=UPI002C313F4E|nr:sigma-70 family RNA polymerase sigma factor [Mycobacterium sp.]HME77199.1 sigma-70 family RNA polymerase sigma factor [Mycobacterium sp.]
MSRLSGPRLAHRPGGWQVAGVVGVDDEAALVRRACAGDERAFVELVAADRSAVWAVCLRITGNRTDAEDALQDTLLAAWRNLAQFRSDAKFSTWLFRIAANAALAIVRRRPETVEIFDVVAMRGDPGDQVADADRVQTALMALPEVFRVALVLRIYGDLSYEDIAVHQGIPVQTVKSRLWRARSMMHELLAPASDTDESPRVPIISE